MNVTMPICRAIFMLFGLLLISSALIAHGPPAETDLLAGPKVEASALQPATARPLANGFNGAKRTGDISPLKWIAVVNSLQLTPQQRSRIKAIGNEFRDQLKRAKSGQRFPPHMFQQRIWTELSPAQREELKEKLRQIRARVIEQRNAATSTPAMMILDEPDNSKGGEPMSEITDKSAKIKRLDKAGADADDQTAPPPQQP